MSQEEAIEQLFEEVRFRVSSQTTPVTFQLIKQVFEICVNEMQYVILPKNIEALSERSQDFERIISQNVMVIGGEDNFEIHGQVIMQQLASEGWIIIPPL